jgi:hypothetical protein
MPRKGNNHPIIDR